MLLRGGRDNRRRWRQEDGKIEAEIDGQEKSKDVDKVLVTVGRKANLQGWGLENTGVRLDSTGRFIRTDRRCRTNVPGVFAIGDVAGEPMLAHKASAEGEMVAELISGLDREFDKVAIPAIIFTEPEIVSVGLDPDTAKERGEDVIIGKFPLGCERQGAHPRGREDRWIHQSHSPKGRSRDLGDPGRREPCG